jgi:hypothetical protein
MIENTESNVISLNRHKQDKEINFKVFAQYIMKTDIESATRVLRDLLQLDYVTSEKVSTFVSSNFEKDPQNLMKLMGLRNLLINGNQNDILAFIQEVFGVTGHVSIYIMMKLTTSNTFQ